MMAKNYQMPQQRGCGNMQQGNWQQTPAPAPASCPGNAQTSCRQMNRAQLMNHINEVSFAVADVLLYLDTHPSDCEALAYCQKMITLRKEALKEYSMRFAPLTIDCTADIDSNCWQWIMQPFPWETTSKGGCR